MIPVENSFAGAVSATYQLLERLPLHIVGETSRRVRHQLLGLPGSCLDVRLGKRAVYGFSASALYCCRFGDNTFQSFAMPIQVTAVLGMLTDNRAVVASGSEIYVVELPM